MTTEPQRLISRISDDDGSASMDSADRPRGRTPPPPTERIPVLRWIKENLASSYPNAFITGVCLVALFYTVPAFLEWGLIEAKFTADSHEDCRAASGACWAVIEEKHRPMFFGVYPFEEHWRLVLALVIYIGSVAVTMIRRFWSYRILVPMWFFTLASTLTLLWGGTLGLPAVDTSQWGGLPLTMVLFSGTLVVGFPLAILLALGRRSHMPAVKAVSVIFIESLRGVPLITILFVAVNVFPLFLPQGLEFDKLLRVMVGMAVFFACYEAEVIRGGLQAIPRGQYEAAEALGLGYWQTMTRIILPQALRICLPGIVNHVIAAFKNTSFVLIIGLFDMLTATTSVLQDPLWRRFTVEAYLCVGFVYFIFCYALSQYSQQVERWLSEDKRF
jgi:general L-amino acid transport system permease protein